MTVMQKKHHNPYFNRWFSAIFNSNGDILDNKNHNPYFNRWFSAIKNERNRVISIRISQSLF